MAGERHERDVGRAVDRLAGAVNPPGDRAKGV
jgi:hypothetical protein